MGTNKVLLLLLFCCTGFRPPCWSPSDGLQHGVSILNTIIFRDTFCRITRVRNIAHPRNISKFFFYYSSTIFQFLDPIYPSTSLLFLLFYSPTPRSQVRILIYGKWSICASNRNLFYMYYLFVPIFCSCL